jgi:hypothetical protein
MASPDHPGRHYEGQLESAGWVACGRDEPGHGAGSNSIWRYEDAEGDTWRAALMIVETYATPRMFLIYVQAWWDPPGLLDNWARGEPPAAPPGP